MRQLEDDVLLTMRVIGNKAETAKDRIEDSVGLVEEIGRASDDLAELAVAAKDITTALARTTQQLDVATQSIERHAAGADLFVAEARQLTDDVTHSMDHLSDAVAKIAGVVSVITSIARRTNLLALNAGIEASRAGPAGRGFVVIANEIKQLANQVQQATEDVTAQTANLRIVARQNEDSVARIARLVGRIDPVFTSIRKAVDGQTSDTRDVSQRAAQSENFVTSVAAKASSVKKLSAGAIVACRDAGEAGVDMNASLHRLTQRAMVFLRHSASSNRREYERAPVKLAAHLTLSGPGIPVIALDISRGGVLIMVDAKTFPRGTIGHLKIPGVGAMRVQCVATSELGAHARFDDVDAETDARLSALVARAFVDNMHLIERVQAASADVMTVFEEGLASAEVTMGELITIDYHAVPGTSPVQYDTAAMPFYERVLPPIIERHRDSEPRPLFVVPVDRNAFCPVHHPEVSLPQRDGQKVWNDLNSRHRRILDRWQTLVGSRNEKPYNLRVYTRHEKDGGKAPIIIISCPIFIRGALWGNMQAGFDY